MQTTYITFATTQDAESWLKDLTALDISCMWDANYPPSPQLLTQVGVVLVEKDTVRGPKVAASVPSLIRIEHKETAHEVLS